MKKYFEIYVLPSLVLITLIGCDWRGNRVVIKTKSVPVKKHAVAPTVTAIATSTAAPDVTPTPTAAPEVTATPTAAPEVTPTPTPDPILQGCILFGQTIASGDTISGYQTSTVAFGQTCVSMVGTCNDGVISNPPAFATCSVTAEAKCTVSGQEVNPGAFSVAAGFTTSSVLFGETCTADAHIGTCANGVATYSHQPASLTCIQQPISLKKIALGGEKTFVINTDGIAKSCGSNYYSPDSLYGQLGQNLDSGGNNNVKITTFQLLNDSGTTYYSISSGGSQTCGITTLGKVKCWGAWGVGDISGTRQSSPVFINDGDSVTYNDITTGAYFACAVASTGVLKCWGDDYHGQLGDGNSAANGNDWSQSPVTAASGTLFKKVAAGRLHTCGITSTNAVKCWGANGSGQIGIGVTSTRVLTIETVDSGVSYTEIAAGESSTCGITTAGILKCWGANAVGQLGDNSIVAKSFPTVIDSGTTYAQIAMAGDVSLHTCGITTAGVLKCWGANTYGQLGNNTTTNSLIPIVIDSGTTYRDISAWFGATCGITTAGELKCWGINTNGQLGLGHTTSPQKLPVLIGTGY